MPRSKPTLQRPGNSDLSLNNPLDGPITDEGMKKLEEALPKCYIEH
jgi:hypothetical protein